MPLSRSWPRRFDICLVAALAGVTALNAMAQSTLMIWPLDPVIESDQRTAALWLENQGTQPVSLQVRIFAWSQSEGRDSYTAQDQVVPSPPIAVVPAGQKQLVRLMNTRPAEPGTQQAFRILVDELPQLETAGATAPSTSTIGIKLQIRYSVPLFVSGPGHWTKVRPERPRAAETAARPQLDWHTVRDGDTHYLVVRNTGTAHARLTAAQWTVGDLATEFAPGLLGYVLPGAQMRWPLTGAPPANSALLVRVNGGAAPLRLPP